MTSLAKCLTGGGWKEEDDGFAEVLIFSLLGFCITLGLLG